MIEGHKLKPTKCAYLLPTNQPNGLEAGALANMLDLWSCPNSSNMVNSNEFVYFIESKFIYLFFP